MESDRDTQFRSFVQERRADLVRTATLLTAGDRHLAEDLVQSTLTKLYVAWPAFRRAANPGGYVYRALTNALTDERRRPWRRERSMSVLPDAAGPERGDAGISDELRQALRELPTRMRAAVVFRYFHGLDVAETAEALGCSQGTVKSQTARALERLRSVLGPPPPTAVPRPRSISELSVVNPI